LQQPGRRRRGEGGPFRLRRRDECRCRGIGVLRRRDQRLPGGASRRATARPAPPAVTIAASTDCSSAAAAAAACGRSATAPAPSISASTALTTSTSTSPANAGDNGRAGAAFRTTWHPAPWAMPAAATFAASGTSCCSTSQAAPSITARAAATLAASRVRLTPETMTAP